MPRHNSHGSCWTLVRRPSSTRAALRCAPPTSHPMIELMLPPRQCRGYRIAHQGDIMQIVPVIDLKGALVVHARRGERGTYAPIVTPLSRSAEPAAVIDGLLSVAPFRAIYVADLDAIMEGGGPSPLIASLADRFPMLEFWVDAGIASPAAAESLLRRERLHLVIGSESQTDHRVLAKFRDHPRSLLSLDFRGDDFIGPSDLLERPEQWPERVIVMTLARVGS